MDIKLVMGYMREYASQLVYPRLQQPSHLHLASLAA